MEEEKEKEREREKLMVSFYTKRQERVTMENPEKASTTVGNAINAGLLVVVSYMAHNIAFASLYARVFHNASPVHFLLNLLSIAVLGVLSPERNMRMRAPDKEEGSI